MFIPFWGGGGGIQLEFAQSDTNIMKQGEQNKIEIENLNQDPKNMKKTQKRKFYLKNYKPDH